MAANNSLEVNEITFESEVVNYSKNIPVVVDFWAEWCAPCKSLSLTLEKILTESRGAFRLAKVNVDENPNLAILYGVRSLPTLKIFTNAQVVAEMVGNQQELRLREFLAKITPPNPLILETEKKASAKSSPRTQSCRKVCWDWRFLCWHVENRMNPGSS
jgi:putative thioredoxin